MTADRLLQSASRFNGFARGRVAARPVRGGHARRQNENPPVGDRGKFVFPSEIRGKGDAPPEGSKVSLAKSTGGVGRLSDSCVYVPTARIAAGPRRHGLLAARPLCPQERTSQ